MSPGVMARSVRSALTGQRGENPNEGMLHILDTILVHCILHILGTILVHCLI